MLARSEDGPHSRISASPAKDTDVAQYNDILNEPIETSSNDGDPKGAGRAVEDTWNRLRENDPESLVIQNDDGEFEETEPLDDPFVNEVDLDEPLEDDMDGGRDVNPLKQTLVDEADLADDLDENVDDGDAAEESNDSSEKTEYGSNKEVSDIGRDISDSRRSTMI